MVSEKRREKKRESDLSSMFLETLGLGIHSRKRRERGGKGKRGKKKRQHRRGIRRSFINFSCVRAIAVPHTFGVEKKGGGGIKGNHLELFVPFASTGTSWPRRPLLERKRKKRKGGGGRSRAARPDSPTSRSMLFY